MLPKIKFIVSKKEIYKELKRYIDPNFTKGLIPYLKKRVKHDITYFRKKYPKFYKEIKETALNFEKFWPRIKRILLNDSENFQEQWRKIEREALRSIEHLFFPWKSKAVIVYFMWAVFCEYSQQDGIRMVARYKGSRRYELSTLTHEIIHCNFDGQPYEFTYAELDAVHACIFLGGWHIAKKLKLPVDKNLPLLSEKERKYIKKLGPYFAKYIKSKKSFIGWFKETYPKVKI